MLPRAPKRHSHMQAPGFQVWATVGWSAGRTGFAICFVGLSLQCGYVGFLGLEVASCTLNPK